MSNLYKSTQSNQTQHNQFIERIVQTLLKLDSQLSPRRSSGSIAEALPELSTQKSQLTGMYRDLVQKFFDVGEIEDNVFVYAVALAKKVVAQAKKN